MSVKPRFPRGLYDPAQATPIATARWASPSEVERFAFERGDLWLGVQPVPHADVAETLAALHAFHAELSANERISEGWKQQTLGQVAAHLDALWATDAVPIGSDDDRHIITIGGTRAGKGTSCIIPNLIAYPGSVICIDPKGENARITASRRGMGSRHCDGLGQSVIVLDPYNTTKLPKEHKASWNPLDMLDVADEMVVDNATSIAEALLIRSKKEDAHFDESSRSLIKALILYVAVVHEGRPDRNLISVYNYLMHGAAAQLEADRGGQAPSDNDPDPFTYLLYLMKRREEFDGIIAGAAQTILDMGDRERGGVLSTAKRQLNFVERPVMRRVLATSSFDIDAIKTDANGATIYLCLPPQRMADIGRWLRLVINTALDRMYEIEEEPATGKPVLFLLEEFASLGHMEIIEHAAGYAAGFGVKLWTIIQDLSQLKSLYKDSWETFLGNAGVIQAFANSDATTLEYLSKKLGEVELSQLVRNTSLNNTATSNDPGEYARMSGLLQARSHLALLTAPAGMMMDGTASGSSIATSTAYNQQVSRSPLLLPDEIERAFRREAMSSLILVKGERPFVLARTNYFDDPRFAGMFDPIKPPVRTKAEALKAAQASDVARANDKRAADQAARSFLKTTSRLLHKAAKASR